MRRALLWLVLVVLVAPGCVHRSARGLFQTRFVAIVPAEADWLEVAPFGGPWHASLSDHMDEIALEMMELGYVMIGYSAFDLPEGVDHDDAAAVTGRVTDAGWWAGAEIVWLEQGYVRPQTPTVVPPSATRYDRLATFWRKARPDPLGVQSRAPVGGLASGLIVTGVLQGSAADRADIVRGDVLLGFNGQRIESPAHLRALSRAHAGKEIVLLVAEGFSSHEVQVQLSGESPYDRYILGASWNVPSAIPEWARSRPGLKEVQGKQGLLVRKVIDGTPADLAGLRPGDFVTRIGDTEVATVEQGADLVHRNAGHATPFEVQRGGSTHVLTIELREERP